MKICLACGAHYASTSASCQDCGAAQAKVDGFVAYAQESAVNGGGFKREYFAELERLEAGNFWFRARNKLIVWAIRKYHPQARSFLEVGCGTGFVLSTIRQSFPTAELVGSELFTDGLKYAASRQPDVNFIQMDARRIPYIDEFDMVGGFDVLEHIDDDRQVLAQLHDALSSSGVMILTVPQHAWLWSRADDYACHVRRYTAKELHEKVRAAGFDILCSTSFVTLLLPAMLASRLMQKSTSADGYDATAEFKLPGFLNWLFERLMDAERMLIRAGWKPSIGGSRLVVARKR